MEGITAVQERAMRVRLSVLGADEAALDGRPIVFRTKKALALLAYLAVDSGPHSRERLADLLWPQSDVAEARASLRTALNYVRQGLGPAADSVIVATRESLGVRFGAPVDLDVQALTHAQHLARCSPGNFREREIEAAVPPVPGPFLSGMPVSDAPPFQAGVESMRTHPTPAVPALPDRLSPPQSCPNH